MDGRIFHIKQQIEQNAVDDAWDMAVVCLPRDREATVSCRSNKTAPAWRLDIIAAVKHTLTILMLPWHVGVRVVMTVPHVGKL